MFNKFLLMGIIVGAVQLACDSNLVESVTSTQQAIRGGQVMATQDEQPYVEVFGNGGCSGTMLTNKWVLTAAHCFGANFVPNANTGKVKMGSQIRNIIEYRPHPSAYQTIATSCNSGGVCPAGTACDYTGKCWDDDYDFALIRVDTALWPYNEGLFQFPLADRSIVPSAGALLGKSLMCRGYGDPGNGTLREAKLDIFKLSGANDSTYQVAINGLGQLTAAGDSGCGCTYAHNGTEQLVGVNVAYSATDDSLRRIEFVRPWIEEVVLRRQLHSRLSGYPCIDVSGGNTADGTALQIWGCNGTAAQNFRLESLRNGLHRIVNTNSNSCVHVVDANGAAGSPIQIRTCDGSRNQSFGANATSAIVNGSAVFSLKNPIAGNCVETSSTNSGTPLKLATCTGGDAQLWWATPSIL